MDAALSEISIRPIRGDDRQRILDAVGYTSPQTYSRRFHELAHRFTERELTYLTEVDGDNHLAIIATERNDPERLVAIARFVRSEAERDEAEFAVTVHDPYQRRGIGSGMLSLLRDAAIEHGITRFRAFIELDNEPMLALMDTLFPRSKRVDRFGRTGEFVADLHQPSNW
jgi:RimJ/RimL family protein N-acetyltransferase